MNEKIKGILLLFFIFIFIFIFIFVLFYKKNKKFNEIVIILIILSIVFILLQNYDENYENYENYENHENDNEIYDIPKNVYLTFITKELPENMKKNLEENIQNNPEFKFDLYDNEMCRTFISKHFDENIVNVFDGLKPGAYKADLFRYCILYINGGVYMDIKLKLHVKIEYLINKYKGEIFVKDPDWYPDSCKRGCNNGFIICKKNNPIFLDCIHQIEKNYKEKYYGKNFLYPTGPCLLGYIIRTKYNDIEYQLYISKTNEYSGFDIVDENNNIMVSSYEGYRDDLALFAASKHYTELYANNDIYE
jgi:mannosyltransferase OCH1-like enzyme